MVSSINSSLSGLAAASKRIEVSANNIANQFSTGLGKTNEPFVPQDVVSVTAPGGGVIAKVQDAANPLISQFDPENPQANEQGFVQAPNVDIAKELVNTKIASYDYKANLKAIEVAGNLEDSLLDIFS